jgi:predicted DNA-binding transcriptional regulator AlpA
MTRAHEQLLTVKELAAALRKSEKYVYVMVAKGFGMPGRVATVSEARKWLARNPSPFASRGRK